MAALIETLYGVVSEGSTFISTPSVDYDLTNVAVSPSQDLMFDLLTLKPATKVGIAYASEFDTVIEKDGIEGSVTEEGKFYWKRIQRLAKRRGLEVIYLDDPQLYGDYITQTRKADNLAEQIEQAQDEKAALDIRREMYKSIVQADHTVQIKREDSLLQRIRETQPQVVIIGRGHADDFILRRDEVKAEGVEIMRYFAERPNIEADPNPVLPWANPLPYERTYIDYTYAPDANSLLERRSLEKKYRAVTEGRVTDIDHPAYIGTWDLDIPAKGLFEVFNGGKGVDFGFIEDVVGSAHLRGEFLDDSIAFDKIYILQVSSPDVLTGEIKYFATLQPNGVFEGTWNSSYFRGLLPFRIAPYTPGMDINATLGY